MESAEQPNSICHVQSIHMYPLQPAGPLGPPFRLMTGETVVHSGRSVDGALVVTNYRLYLEIGDSQQHHVALGLVELVEHRDLFYLHVGCKDGRSYRCTFENNEKCLEWYDLIQKAADPPRQLEQLFAFYHCVWAKENGGEEVVFKLKNQKKYIFNRKLFDDEMTRLQFEGDAWRISKANENYKLCPTYPPYLLVPSCISDDQLESVAKFRSSRRIPAAVWRHTRNGAVIARCSQPEVGWLGWRSAEDEDLIKAFSDACNFDRTNGTSSVRTNGSDRDSNLSHSPGSFHSDESLQITNDIGRQQEKKVLIMDARSYTTAVANRARGGGCECPEYYPNCDVQFMNLANIHSIRKSFHALRQLCTSSAEQPNWFSQLEGTRWLLHMSGLMKAAVTLVTAVERDARPVLVHCSDGWDRTPQIVALAELLLDPYYRTIDGFRILIEREWLAFGHKFADRCGHSTGSDDQNERCPVFLQWLDCVHQLLLQFECAFEFSQAYLVKLAQHAYSNLFGTFLCNTLQERSNIVYGKTFSVWEFLGSQQFRNHLYAPVSNSCSRRVLWPQCNVRDLRLWSEVYLGAMEASFGSESGAVSCPGPPGLSPQHMTKTRSYGDLVNAGEASASQYRRCSDPSINNCDSNLSVLTSAAMGADGPGAGDFPGDLEDADCNQDCMFKGSRHDSLTDDQIDGLHPYGGGGGGGRATNGHRNGGEESAIESETEAGEAFATTRNGAGDSSEAATPACSETTVAAFLEAGRSVETSTETLVSDHVTCSSSSPKEINGFEKVIGPATEFPDDTDGCRTCQNGQRAQDERKAPALRYANGSNGWAGHGYPGQQTGRRPYQHQLGEDGLVPLRCVVQERLEQIIDEQKRKVDLLEKELHVTRQNLIKQSCQKCCHSELDRQDDNSSAGGSATGSEAGGEGRRSAAGESLRSDVSSWVAVEEGALADCQGTLWVPDHAVSRCTGCGTEFWLGRRRHHCRKCGKIFCADCSENSTPLPAEQLYDPVRVCTGCYSELRRDVRGGIDIPNRCKHPSPAQQTGASQQIAASSN